MSFHISDDRSLTDLTQLAGFDLGDASALRGWNVPDVVEHDGDTLWWWTNPLSPGHVPSRGRGGLLNAFIRLSEADAKEICSFAEKWGPLCPWREDGWRGPKPAPVPTAIPAEYRRDEYVPPRRGRFAQPKVDWLQGAEGAEGIVEWRAVARTFELCLRSHLALVEASTVHRTRRERTAQVKIATDLIRELPILVDGLPSGPSVVIFNPAKPGAFVVSGTLKAGRLHVSGEDADKQLVQEAQQAVVNGAIRVGHAHFELALVDSFRTTAVAGSVLGELGLQLAAALTGGKGIAVCSHCQDPYTYQRRPREGQRTFCPKCRDENRPQRYASKAWKDRNRPGS